MSNVRPCPGIERSGCGKPRKPAQAYCEECGREYQRNRYRMTRLAAGSEYTERVYTRTSTEKCLICRKLPKDGILSKCEAPFEKFLVCDLCIALVQTIHTLTDRSTLLRVAQYYDIRPLEFNPERLAFTLANAKQHRMGIAVEQRKRAIAECNYYRPGMKLDGVENTPEWAELRIQEIQTTRYSDESRANALLYYNEYCEWLGIPQLQTLFGLDELDTKAPVEAYIELLHKLEPYLQYL